MAQLTEHKWHNSVYYGYMAHLTEQKWHNSSSLEFNGTSHRAKTAQLTVYQCIFGTTHFTRFTGDFESNKMNARIDISILSNTVQKKLKSPHS